MANIRLRCAVDKHKTVMQIAMFVLWLAASIGQHSRAEMLADSIRCSILVVVELNPWTGL